MNTGNTYIPKKLDHGQCLSSRDQTIDVQLRTVSWKKYGQGIFCQIKFNDTFSQHYSTFCGLQESAEHAVMYNIENEVSLGLVSVPLN